MSDDEGECHATESNNVLDVLIVARKRRQYAWPTDLLVKEVDVEAERREVLWH